MTSMGITTNWAWAAGRQGAGYQKLLVAQGSWWDVWLLWYPPATSIPIHTDPVDGKEHHRLNILLKGWDSFVCLGGPYWKWWRFTKFRPDIQQHAVPYNSQSPARLLLSIGWIR